MPIEKVIQTRIINSHDTEANWESEQFSSFIPKLGELIVYDIDENYSYERFKIGDGKTSIKKLPFCIVDADNIVFNEDIIITTAVGNIAINESGSGVIPSRGKNLKQVFEAIWTQENDPETTLPAITINTEVQYKEVGSTVAPVYDASLSAGEYTYGPETGITAKSWSVTLGSETKTTASGTFSNMVVTEGNCCNVTATATYNDGAIPVTNLGNPVANDKNLQIKAGSASGSKNIIVGYKPNFYGFKTSSIDINSINSNVVRAFGTNQKQTTTPVKSAKSSVSWMQFFYAVPKGRKTSLSAKDSNNLPLTVNKTEVTVNHEGSASSTYTVFYINNDAAYGATTLTLTWS